MLNNLAFVMNRQGDPAALAYARRAHAAAPESAAVADTLGWVLVTQGRAEEGLRYLREAHTRSDSPSIRYHLAEALAAMGREDEALEELRAMLRQPAGTTDAKRAQALMQRLSP